MRWVIFRVGAVTRTTTPLDILLGELDADTAGEALDHARVRWHGKLRAQSFVSFELETDEIKARGGALRWVRQMPPPPPPKPKAKRNRKRTPRPTPEPFFELALSRKQKRDLWIQRAQEVRRQRAGGS